jgi:hypothetical protein
MSAIAQSVWGGNKNWVWIGCVSLGLCLIGLIATPNLLRAPSSQPKTANYLALSEQGVGEKTDVALSQSAVHAVNGALAPTAAPARGIPDRKIVRASCMELTVTSPADAAEKIRAFTESLGGYVESAQISSNQETPTATITIRVPAARLEDAKAQLRSLATKVNSEKTDAQDVTKQYVDMEAGLRNLRAEEAQYLQIMQSAKKVPDMLEVSEKLSEVRGEIERQQAEFATLAKQVETVAITISLLPIPKPESFGLNWQPLHQLQVAGYDALDGLAGYAGAMASVIFYLPVVALWVGTIFLAVLAGWRILRWVAKFFTVPRTAVSTTRSS